MDRGMKRGGTAWVPSRVYETLIVLIFAVLAIVSVQVLIATPLLSWRLVGAGPWWSEWVVGVLVASGWIAFLLAARQQVTGWLASVVRAINSMPRLHFVGIVLGLGLVLRIGWVLIYPASPASDGLVYLNLGERLSDGLTYTASGTRAYWPPGYALLLAPVVWLAGTSASAIAALNASLFLLTGTISYLLGRNLFNEGVGRVALLAIAIWPTHIAMTGLPEKEYAVIPLVVLIILLLYGLSNRLLYALVAGVTLGLATLIQPSLLLLPSAVLFSDLLQKRTVASVVGRMAAIAAGMALVIAPWTVRNYTVFDEFVLISTNSGSVMYRANNPVATGGYIPRGEVDLDQYSELEADRVGGELAREWILENPIQFLGLAIEKQILFLGDDSTGIYATLRRGNLGISEAEYALWKTGANGYWYVLWSLAFLVLIRRGIPMKTARTALPIVLPFLYLYAIHSIAESDAKYHLPALGLLAVFFALTIMRGSNVGADGDARWSHGRG